MLIKLVTLFLMPSAVNVMGKALTLLLLPRLTHITQSSHDDLPYLLLRSGYCASSSQGLIWSVNTSHRRLILISP